MRRDYTRQRRQGGAGERGMGGSAGLERSATWGAVGEIGKGGSAGLERSATWGDIGERGKGGSAGFERSATLVRKREVSGCSLALRYRRWIIRAELCRTLAGLGLGPGLGLGLGLAAVCGSASEIIGGVATGS